MRFHRLNVITTFVLVYVHDNLRQNTGNRACATYRESVCKTCKCNASHFPIGSTVPRVHLRRAADLAYSLESCSLGATQWRSNCQSLTEDEKFHAERESTDHCETRLVY
jgi:hypothetical protein